MPWCYGTVLTLVAWRCKAELRFQHDRAPAYSGDDVWQWLNMTYPRSLTGCGELTAWPHWYLELNFSGFCMWWHLKHVYAGKSRSCSRIWGICEKLTLGIKACSRMVSGTLSA
jgi:hypothetical protein